MISQRQFIARIPCLRPLRPPWTHRPRGLHQQPHLLALPRSSLRPQVPYLAPSRVHRGTSPIDRYALRVLSTERRRRARIAASTVIKAVVYSAILISLTKVILWTIDTEVLEHMQPTPAEWKYLTRHNLRHARSETEAQKAIVRGYFDWVEAGKGFSKVIADLEKDDQGILKQQDDSGAALEIGGLGLAGPDVSGKSWQWVQGYYEALMGAALASENTDDMVRDTTRNLVFPSSTVIGASNPDPRPVSRRMTEAPLAEHCERVFPPPETFYMKILTGRGFTTRQKVTAAIAYGKWLEYSKLNDAALEMFKWSIDIAKQPIHNSEKLLKAGSFVLNQQDAVPATENLLHAITAMGVHQARTGHVQTALPILLAAFKARREARVAPQPPSASIPSPKGHFEVLMLIFKTPEDMKQQPSGDEPLSRAVNPNCEDSELMMYIGELMFASTAKQDEGLVWTKQAAEVASREVSSLSMPIFSRAQYLAELKKCKQCLLTSVKNWTLMVDELVERSRSSASSGWYGQKASRSSQFDGEDDRLEALQATALRLQSDADVEDMVRSSKFAMFEG